MKKLLYKLINFTITAKEKAFVAFWAAAVSSYLTANGLVWHDLLHQATLWSVLAGVVSHQLVYWVENSQRG